MRGRKIGRNNRGTRDSAYRHVDRACSTQYTRHTKGMTGTVQGARTPRTQSNRAQTRQYTAAPHMVGRAHMAGTARTKKHKRVHKSTFNCAKMIAWSTGDRPDRLSRHAPLAPLIQAFSTKNRSVKCLFLCILLYCH